MTDSFSMLDFNSLKKENQVNGASEPIAGEISVSEANLEEIIKSSQQKIIFMLVTSSRVPAGASFVDEMRETLSRYSDTISFALLDADAEPRVAAALGLNSLPAALIFLKGQLQPLFEGVVGKEQLEPVLQNLVQLAAQEGMQNSPTNEEANTPQELEAAFTALEAGDFETAKTKFSEHLETHPHDEEAKKGLAMIELFKRTENVELNESRRQAADNPEDISAQLLAADLDLLGGHVDDAFGRLLSSFVKANEDDRQILKARLLEFFEVVGASDERVVAARKRLSRLMF